MLGFAAQALAIRLEWLNLLQYLVPAAVFVLALNLLFRRRAAARPVAVAGHPAALAGARA